MCAFLNFHNRVLCAFSKFTLGVCTFFFTTLVCVHIFKFHKSGVCLCILEILNNGVCAISTFTKSVFALSTITAGVCAFENVKEVC